MRIAAAASRRRLPRVTAGECADHERVIGDAADRISDEGESLALPIPTLKRWRARAPRRAQLKNSSRFTVACARCERALPD